MKRQNGLKEISNQDRAITKPKICVQRLAKVIFTQKQGFNLFIQIHSVLFLFINTICKPLSITMGTRIA